MEVDARKVGIKTEIHIKVYYVHVAIKPRTLMQFSDSQ